LKPNVFNCYIAMLPMPIKYLQCLKSCFITPCLFFDTLIENTINFYFEQIIISNALQLYYSNRNASKFASIKYLHIAKVHFAGPVLVSF
jgi:hypothetical protein